MARHIVGNAIRVSMGHPGPHSGRLKISFRFGVKSVKLDKFSLIFDKNRNKWFVSLLDTDTNTELIFWTRLLLGCRHTVTGCTCKNRSIFSHMAL